MASCISCKVCGAQFSVKPSRVGLVRFCSKACRSIGTRIPPWERLAGKYVVTEDGCWTWTGKRTNGYGIIAASVVTTGVAPRELRAHRVSYELHVGPIPEGLDLDHLCRNPACVNPEHLEPVTRWENLRRGVGEHRPGLTHCKRGHEFTPENTYVTKAGYRNCRECHRLYERERRRAVT